MIISISPAMPGAQRRSPDCRYRGIHRLGLIRTERITGSDGTMIKKSATIAP
jgi:hypothetical protein